MRQTMTKIHTDKDKVFMRDRVQPMPNAAQKKIAFQAARGAALPCPVLPSFVMSGTALGSAAGKCSFVSRVLLNLYRAA